MQVDNILDNNKDIGLYSPRYEHDACGIAAVANIRGMASYKVVCDALEILMQLEHRGGAGAEENSGDGAGILIQIPHDFFLTQELGFVLPQRGNYGVAQMFLSPNFAAKEEAKEIFLQALKDINVEFLGFREVPVNPSDLGATALKAMPYFLQAFVKKPDNIQSGIEFERLLYKLRRLIEKRTFNVPKFYFSSFSSRTIVYKGMLLSTQLSDFYLDFKDVNMKSAIALVHSRFSTNTFPSWERAHPNRYMVHNGEINTIHGNVHNIMAREGLMQSDYFEDLQDIFPIIAKPSSDSAMFDNTLEFLALNGRTLEEAFMMMVPEPWHKNSTMGPKKRAFYEYNSMLMEPWDGPAAIIFTDGIVMGASLDRNGFRPSRYYLTKDDFLILSSETGALKLDEKNIKAKKRLEPGKLLLVDTARGRLIADEELKSHYANAKPYEKWLKNLIHLDKQHSKNYKHEFLSKEEVLRLQKAFAYNYDELSQSILPMAQHGKEALGAMGVDTPLAVLSKQYQPLYNYFKQLFAQVTNPPLDAIREEIVTSTRIYLGREGNLLKADENNAKRVKISLPIISNEELFEIRSLKKFQVKEFSLLYDYNKKSLENALSELFERVEEEIKKGVSIIILSDKGVNAKNAYIPSLLAVSGLHNYLVRKSLRTHASIIIQTGEAREIHHFACLLGYGATVINPYLVYESIYQLIENKNLNLSYEDAILNFIKASSKGIVKIASKMGVSTLQSYNGSALFECLGLNSQMIDKYFTLTTSRIEGISLQDYEKELINIHKNAFTMPLKALDSMGVHELRSQKEEHLLDPLVIFHLQNSCKNNDYKEFKKYSALIDKKQLNLRSLMEFDFSEAIDIEKVESVESIMKRFKTGAMSYGSISKEAHECLAMAMNLIGAKSNSGEGGEDESRYVNDKNSAIKQVASGRFGVDLNYLVHAKEIQIKVAQGAKPGEGGQLMGFKVYPWIAKARHSTPGVTLISPPPHHDIYSIEDLAQLIYDLKNANKDAKISVKLVSESGIGTVAAGVAKAGANLILVSGYDGGTGASPRTSIANAGIPWELGLAETHQTLILNNLRERVRLETDGKLMNGRDLAIAALLGAEEFGFATAPLIVLGCTMMRVCHLNTCPFGIATQDTKLRNRFKGKAEHVVNFMRFIAQDLREYMARLGFEKLDDMIGRVDKLRQKEIQGKASKINLDRILKSLPTYNKNAVHFQGFKDNKLEKTIDYRILLPLCKSALAKKEPIKLSLQVSNLSRTFATMLSSEILKHYGKDSLKEDSIHINAIGNAGNSFGAFLARGIVLEIIGDSNDYLGKGLSGGKIIARISQDATFSPEENIIAGNACLYGATEGEVYLDGIAGERFCVRNSGAKAVVLGTGVHGCEYMTGGLVVVLGDVGVNFGAGMSGGEVFIFGRHNEAHVNTELVDIKALSAKDEKVLKAMIEKHIFYTNSKKAKNILQKFDKKDFFKVMPRDYEKMLKMLEFCKKEADPELSAFLKLSKKG
ncbi:MULTISPECIES: glutamate synthase large subunit [unclassified Campylobacter]|uniref:glutamate synthase large subunit n=1 Tax=unclassified Campylobacter TaxID=2593542 RepID=UPI001238152D|nr:MULTISPECIES: glutamate synthase large subunit [unclassified Campylobacter]KAA6227214.1 glutamate synthase large subunit [Campylobacter sp. LR286c]KAA6227912.1 glutamate synthase large subunit [Campylobacter sp. LR185c]KAA6228321.1 glutamate synthase large subunit [Campylobacter sp. LR196d]KAA6229322.1 glutamate synthase large subunit [Campylobacter sp. LR291e]KAA8604401.1 glutamate synthase large subunit [Campylobacter sp. LR185c]